MTAAKDVVMGFQAAMGRDDWTGARSHLSDHLQFTGPFESFTKPESYLEALQKLHHIVDRVDVHKVFTDGDDVCVLYDLVTHTPAGTAFVAEWHHVSGAKIDRIRVVFDARPFAPMMGK
ncbi:MAG: nuclear transport factor 2 family protein [Thermoplasmata archaeon]|nr:nuclear transport factor 2 family protein [Thermoplasmata archaeon]MCI4354055.1 nuclear transport factor 2 family protein [Thermoplasmata archaeon]